MRQLEQSLGLALLHRSPRRLSLTEAGERCHAGCAAMVAAARSAEQALARLRNQPEGELRLAGLPVYAVTPRRGEQPAKVRHALDLLPVYFAGAATA
ncbi:MAG: hypothetical protein Q8M91_18030 [Polaromonas sp.]|nr:hypothetical protein [Polaromonas sp.]